MTPGITVPGTDVEPELWPLGLGRTWTTPYKRPGNVIRLGLHPFWVRLHSGMNLCGLEGLPEAAAKAETVVRGPQLCVYN